MAVRDPRRAMLRDLTEWNSPYRVRLRTIKEFGAFKFSVSLYDVPVESGNVPTQAGPIPDRVAIWPLESGHYGLDATFQGASGYDRADWHVKALKDAGVRHSFR